MAKNRARSEGRKLNLNVSAVQGSGTAGLVKSGDPGAVGSIPFVALTDEDANGFASIDTKGVYDLAVTGVGAAGANAAIGVGDILHWDNAGRRLVAAAFGGASVFFGYALGAVAGGATTTIEVRVGR